MSRINTLLTWTCLASAGIWTGAPALAAADDTAVGIGAFRPGATLQLGDGVGNSLLERLRTLEMDRDQARLDLAARDRLIGELKRALDDERTRSEALTSKVQFLEHARISLENARQEIADRGQKIEALELQLAQSEVQRLRSERFLYDIASDLLASDLGDIATLTAIQGRLRARIVNTETMQSVGTMPKKDGAK